MTPLESPSASVVPRRARSTACRVAVVCRDGSTHGMRSRFYDGVLHSRGLIKRTRLRPRVRSITHLKANAVTFRSRLWRASGSIASPRSVRRGVDRTTSCSDRTTFHAAKVGRLLPLRKRAPLRHRCSPLWIPADIYLNRLLPARLLSKLSTTAAGQTCLPR